jgi:hypothetical protein
MSEEERALRHRSSAGGAQRAADILKQRASLLPAHLAGYPHSEDFSIDWFERCNAAYVKAVREHHPEKEVTEWKCTRRAI